MAFFNFKVIDWFKFGAVQGALALAFSWIIFQFIEIEYIYLSGRSALGDTAIDIFGLGLLIGLAFWGIEYIINRKIYGFLKLKQSGFIKYFTVGLMGLAIFVIIALTIGRELYLISMTEVGISLVYLAVFTWLTMQVYRTFKWRLSE